MILNQTTVWLAQAIGFGALAAIATRLVWHRAESLIGITLIFCSFVTTAAYFGTSFESRAALELCLAVLLVYAAKLVHASRPSYSAAAVVCLAIADMAFCASLATEWIAPDWQAYVYDTVTNWIFALCCLAVGAPGVKDAIVDYRRRRADAGPMGRAHGARHDSYVAPE